MVLTLPNRADVPLSVLAELDRQHFRIATGVALGTGVVTGCAVTSNGVTDQVQVSAGTVCVRTNFSDVLTVQTKKLAAADATYSRFDVLVVDEAGSVIVFTGTPAQTPVFPTVDPSLYCAIGAVLRRPGDTVVPSNQILDLGVPIPGEYRYDGQLFNRLNVARLIAYGHSLLAGLGASDPDRDTLTHLTAMLPVREIDRAKGGAVVSWHNYEGAVPAGQGDGGWAHVYQYERRDTRAGTTLAAIANAGATTITLTAADIFANGQAIHIGTGDPSGAAGGEGAVVAAGGGTTTVTLDTALTRTHQSGEPVYEVPAAYLKLNPLYVVWFGLNDLARTPISSAYYADIRARFTDSMRAVIARCRQAEMYEDTHSSCVYTGSRALG